MRTDDFLTTEQVAEILGVRPNTLEIWRSHGGGPPFVKIGRLVRYRSGDLEAWIARHTRENTSQNHFQMDPGKVC